MKNGVYPKSRHGGNGKANDCPCYQCRERTATCHGSCERYQGFCQGIEGSKAAYLEKIHDVQICESYARRSAYLRKKRKEQLKFKR